MSDLHKQLEVLKNDLGFALGHSSYMNEEAQESKFEQLIKEIEQYKDNAIATYKSRLLAALPKKQDEHPIDLETGKAVETYGYEEQHNALLAAVHKVVEEVE